MKEKMIDAVAAPEMPRGGRADAISKKIADDIVLGRFAPIDRTFEDLTGHEPAPLPTATQRSVGHSSGYR